MTLTAFAALFGAGLTIKYCDLTLASGDNDGSSWANAWRTGAAAEAGNAAGNCVAFKSRSITQTATTWVTAGVAGTVAAPIVWVAVDDSDNVVDDTNWKQNGGAVGVTIDMTGSVGDIRGFTCGAGRSNRYMFGFQIIGANYGFAFLSARCVLFYCESKNSRTAGMFTNQAACVYYKCICDGDAIGLSTDQLGTMRFLLIKGCVTGTNFTLGSFSSCVFAGNTTAIAGVSSVGVTVRNCVFYGNTTHIDLSNVSSRRLILIDTLIMGGTTGVNTNSTTQNVDMFNVKWRSVTNITAGAGAANVFNFDGSGELAEDPMVDPANGDYTSKSTVAALKNIAARINAATYEYSQAGLIQQVVAGGGAQLGAFETGAWR